MAKWVHTDVLDNGLLYIKNNCNKVILASTYTSGDSYATVNGNNLADAAMTSTDFTLSGSSSRVLTTASGKQDTAANASGGGASMHICFVDTVNSKVLWVTDETSDQTITIGNPVTFPSLTYTANQPT